MAVPHRVVLAITGASGIQYAQCLLQALALSRVETHVVFSEAALDVWRAELDIPLKGNKPDLAAFAGVRPEGVTLYQNSQVGAPIASGSFRHRGMVVCPCSMSTLGAIASGSGDKLIGRAAEVTLKERRKLIVVPRETPYSLIALRNMATLAEAGAVILDANPGFYARPKTADDMVRFVVARVLDHLEIDHKLSKRWGERA
ncbi:MAG: UbiX family flavin prenyltransferase [Planctomycetes bacterium]|jgi:4-hydroxy-3-polyprenylbenzoate decarboxylase|nr:UbiX family flavin prenyltransferase [Planctomycetota bacterium]MCL4729524.1 UbiX family flavin prenyltransferase [Planctomycetota bacterium]